MKKRLLYMMLPALAALAAGCSDHDAPLADAADAERVLVTFNLTVDSPAEATRAVYEGTWGGTYESENGTTFDNAIKDIYPVLYRVNSSGAITSAVARMVRTSATLRTSASTTTKAVYEIHGVLEKLNESQSDTDFNADITNPNNKFRIAVFANHNPGSTALQYMAPDKFTAYGVAGQTIGTGETATTFSYIPMWGVLDVDLTKLKIGTSYNMGEIPMLRAMAQVRLTISDGMWSERKARLVSLKINRLQPEGFITSLLDWSKVATINNLNITDTPNTPSSVGNTSEIKDFPVEAGDDETLQRTLTFYLPEIENSASMDEDELKLTVTYTIDEQPDIHTGEIYFRPYSEGGVADNGNQYHIIRNHIYEYTIIGVPASYKPEIQLAIRKWGYEERHPEL